MIKIYKKDSIVNIRKEEIFKNHWSSYTCFDSEKVRIGSVLQVRFPGSASDFSTWIGVDLFQGATVGSFGS